MHLAYFGHHKCASTWIWRILAGVCREAGLRHGLIIDKQTPASRGPLTDHSTTFSRQELPTVIQNSGYDFVSCITADATQLNVLRPIRGFHVVRDPRDVIVSAYFSHRNSHPVDDLPHLAAHRQRLRSVSKEEGLFLEMEFSQQELQDMAAWDYECSDILELKMEEMTAAPYNSFLKIFSFLELLAWESPTRMVQKFQRLALIGRNRLSWRHAALSSLRKQTMVTGEQVLGYVYANRFEKKAGGRSAGAENPKSHYRKGVAGDWINHFTPDHVRVFREEFGDALITMGYESDLNWTLPSPVQTNYSA